MNLIARTKPLEVDIELAEPVPTDEESEKDFKALTGMTEVRPETIKSLRKVGLHVKRQGILETQRGTVYVNQSWLLAVSGALYRLIMARAAQENPDVDEVCKLADHIAKLSGKQAELSAVMLSHEPKAPMEFEPERPANKSFIPGSIVVGGNAQVFVASNDAEKGVAPKSNGS